MSESANPHDQLFKATFKEKEIARDFLIHNLPKDLAANLDYDSLSLVPGSYITPELQPFYSDITYECLFGEQAIKISILFEHKSYKPRYPHIQLLRYMVEIWSQEVKSKKALQPVLPIIVYHGKQKWKKKPFPAYFEASGILLEPYIPNLDFILVDLNDLSDEEILAMNAGLLMNTLLLFKHHGENDYIRNSVERLFTGLESLAEKEYGRNKIVSFCVYLWSTSNINGTEFMELMERLPQPIKEETMTTFEQIVEMGRQEGIKEGIKEGIEEGIQEGKIERENEIIRNSLKEGLELSLICKLTDLSKEEVEKRISEWENAEEEVSTEEPQQ